jgi:hypothetical protein
VTNGAFHHSFSKSKTHFDLILCLHKLEMRSKLFIHLIWVAETQMIEQGMNGASRGDLSNGVMYRKAILDFIPLDQGVNPHARAYSLVWGILGGGGLLLIHRVGSIMFTPKWQFYLVSSSSSY